MALLAVCLLLSACVTTLEQGERRYREGDRLGALETWRSIDRGQLAYPAAQRRIAEVEEEFERLVVRYRQQGRYYERKGRLAESVLSFRLALKLQPEDRATLERVQKLMRTLATRREQAQHRFRERFGKGDLAGAREAIAKLRKLDPFAPQLAQEERVLQVALTSQIDHWMAEGRRDFTSGRYRSAERAFRRVLALDRENESAQGYLAYIARFRAEARRGSPVVAARVEAREMNASDSEIRGEGFFQNALAAAAAGDAYAAIRFDLAALQADPENARAGHHLTALRRTLRPEVAGLIDSGRERYRQEDLQAALDQWRRALLIDPGNRQAREYAGRAERLLENLERLRDEPAPPVSTGSRP